MNFKHFTRQKTFAYLLTFTLLNSGEVLAMSDTDEVDWNKTNRPNQMNQKTLHAFEFDPEATDLISLDNGLKYRILVEGQGELPLLTDAVVIEYQGHILNGQTLSTHESDAVRSKPFLISTAIPGWQIALQKMRVGSEWQILIPAELGHGSKPHGVIPADATLIYQIKLLQIVK